MPLTINLSKAIYDALGEEAAKELVILLNASYEASRTEFREMLDARFATFEARMDTKLAALEAKLVRWMFVFWAGTMATVIALLKL